MHLKIPADLTQGLLDYLRKRPYEEVFQIIPALQRLPGIDEKDPELKASGPPETQST